MAICLWRASVWDVAHFAVGLSHVYEKRLIIDERTLIISETYFRELLYQYGALLAAMSGRDDTPYEQVIITAAADELVRLLRTKEGGWHVISFQSGNIRPL